MKDDCRNNVGGWPTRHVEAPHCAKDSLERIVSEMHLDDEPQRAAG
jgi:hypothetical protein